MATVEPEPVDVLSPLGPPYAAEVERPAESTMANTSRSSAERSHRRLSQSRLVSHVQSLKPRPRTELQELPVTRNTFRHSIDAGTTRLPASLNRGNTGAATETDDSQTSSPGFVKGAWADISGITLSGAAEALMSKNRRSSVMRSDFEPGFNHPVTDDEVCQNCVHPMSPLRMLWDYLLLIFIILDVILVPMTFAWTKEKIGVPIALTLLSDLVFLLDIPLNFVTAFYSRENGVEVLIADRMAVAEHYVKGNLIIDVLSIGVPFSDLANSEHGLNVLGPFSLLKILRVARLNRVISRLFTFSVSVLHVVRTVRQIIVFLFITHFLGCGFYLVGQYSCRTEGDCWLRSYGIEDTDEITSQYLISFYWSMMTVTTIGYGDIVAVTLVERSFAVLAMIVGTLMYVVIFGMIMQIISLSTATSDRAARKMEAIEEFVEQHGIPDELADRMRGTMRFIYNLTKHFKPESLLSELPSRLRSDVYFFLHRSLISRVPMFEACDETFIRTIVQHLSLQLFLENDTVVEEGEPGNEMFFVRQGTLEVLSPGGGGVVIGYLQPGSFFGEIAILSSHIRRFNSIVSLTKSELYSLSREHFENVLGIFPEYEEPFRASAIRRIERTMGGFEGEKSPSSTLTSVASRADVHMGAINVSKSHLVVEVIGARGLKAANRDGTSDPYACVVFGKHTVKTKVLWNCESLAPMWNETFSFPILASDDSQSLCIVVEIYDKDHFSSSNFLGQATYPVSELEPDNEVCEWIRLCRRRGSHALASGSMVNKTSESVHQVTSMTSFKKKYTTNLLNKAFSKTPSQRDLGEVRLRICHHKHTTTNMEALHEADAELKLKSDEGVHVNAKPGEAKPVVKEDERQELQHRIGTLENILEDVQRSQAQMLRMLTAADGE